MREVDRTLAAFTSELALRLSKCTVDQSSPPLIETYGTLLQVDIAGSSALAEKIAAEHDADEFAALLNTCFGWIVATIQSFGGEVVEFAGDSVIALWEHGHTQEASAPSIRCAAAAALALNQFQSANRFDHIGPVALRSAVATGPIIVAGIGGLDRDRRLFMTGRAIVDLALAINYAEPATAAISDVTWKLGQHSLSVRGQPGETFLLTGVAEFEALASHQSLAAPSAAGVQSYIPKNIRQISDPALIEWLAELRTTTMVFCRLSNDQVSDKTEILKIHKAVRLIQGQCKRYHGLLETVRADDKGTTLMVAFGLPLPSLERRRSSVLDFTQKIANILASLGYKPGIGISTGRVFQGPVGALGRRQFAFAGLATILGCRLMQLSCNNILCDKATKLLAETDARPWRFQEYGTCQLKGFAEPICVFRAIRRAEKHLNNGRKNIVGRSAEISLIYEQVEKLLSGNKSLTVIVGEAGVGKTLIVQEALYRAGLEGCISICSAADAITQTTPYEPWRQILASLFGMSLRNDKIVMHRLREVMDRAETDADLFPLMNDVFRLGIEESRRTKSLRGLARAKATQKILSDMILHHVGNQPCLIILEDTHWCDLPSLELCLLVLRKCRHVGIIFTQRPSGGGIKEEWERISSQRGAVRITLKNLDHGEIAEFVRASTNNKFVPRAFVDSIKAATDGNPFFIEQVLKSHQREQANPRLKDAPKAKHLDLMSIDIPNTLEIAVLQRVDELGPKEQLLLKSASAIGDTFSINALLRVHTPEESESKIQRRLKALVKRGFIIKRGDRDSATYSICHQLMRKVIYEVVPRRQLAAIHARVARWYESGHEGPRAKYLAQLAHHWLLAGVHNKALVYLSHAGQRSLRSGAHNEAHYFFKTALDLAGRPRIRRGWRGGSLRLARLEANLSQALWGGGALDAASLHATRALRLIGFRVPRTRRGWLLLAVRHLFTLPLPVQMGFGWKRILRRRRQALDSGAGAAIVIAQVAYFTSDALRMLAGSLLSLRLGSSCTTGASVGRSYAYLGYMSGVIRLEHLAEELFQRAVLRSRSDGDVIGLAYAHGGQALYHLGFGRWNQAGAAVKNALIVCREIGDPQLLETALTLKAMLHYFRGEVQQSDSNFSEIFTSAQARSSNHHLAWGAYGRAENLLHLGKTQRAARLIDRAKKFLIGQSDFHSDLICHGLDAVTQLRLGNVGSARKEAFAAVELGERVLPNNFSSLEGYAAPVETLLRLQRLNALDDDQRYLEKAFRSMSQYARLFPIGRPRLWYLRGLTSYIEGELASAEKNWIRSLQWSSNLEMRYEEYRAYEALLLIDTSSIEKTKARAAMDALSLEFGYMPCWADVRC